MCRIFIGITLLREYYGEDLLYGLTNNVSKDNHQGATCLPSAKANHRVASSFLKLAKNQHPSYLFHMEFLMKLEYGVKSVRIWSVCGSYFPPFGLNTDFLRSVTTSDLILSCSILHEGDLDNAKHCYC